MSRLSRETKLKISLSLKGHKIPDESKLKMRLAKLGKPSKKRKHFEGDKFEKPCPKCGYQLKYTCQGHLNYSIKNNCMCRKCSQQGKKYSVETKRKISNIKKQNPTYFNHSPETIKK